MEQTIQKGHPKGLYLLFVTEMWDTMMIDTYL